MSPADYLATLAEPTRLRVLSALAAAPLYVSELVAVLGLPQPTVSRHLRVLRSLGLALHRREATRVAYRIAVPSGAQGRMVRGVLQALRADPAFRADTAAARARVVARLPERSSAHVT
jgi:ArsR family transcriptional regulator